jgi:hypothetical protein
MKGVRKEMGKSNGNRGMKASEKVDASAQLCGLHDLCDVGFYSTQRRRERRETRRFCCGEFDGDGDWFTTMDNLS